MTIRFRAEFYEFFSTSEKRNTVSWMQYLLKLCDFNNSFLSLKLQEK